MSGGQTANPGAVTRLPGCPIAKIAEESPVLTGGRGRAFGRARALYSARRVPRLSAGRAAPGAVPA
jgi:hypothetical protein